MLAFVVTFLISAKTEAQIRVNMQMNKRTYVLHEPVKAILQITNQTGSDLTLSSTPNKPWVTFNATIEGQMLAKGAIVNYNKLVIPVGKTVSTEIMLSESYSFGEQGNYACEAAINLPGTSSAVSSNRCSFLMSNGRIAWSERAGVPGKQGETREFRLVSFTGNGSLELFAEVHSVNKNHHMATIPFGKVLNFRNPRGVIDRANTMHVLCQVQPEFFAYYNIGLDGKVLKAHYIKRGAATPTLVKREDGNIMVTGGTIFDPKEDAVKRKKIHDASERPSTIYK